MRNVKQAVPFFAVAEMERSLKFYIDGLGFALTQSWSPEGKIRWCLLELGGAALMLQEFANPPEGKPGVGVSSTFNAKTRWRSITSSKNAVLCLPSRRSATTTGTGTSTIRTTTVSTSPARPMSRKKPSSRKSQPDRPIHLIPWNKMANLFRRNNHGLAVLSALNRPDTATFTKFSRAKARELSGKLSSAEIFHRPHAPRGCATMPDGHATWQKRRAQIPTRASVVGGSML